MCVQFTALNSRSSHTAIVIIAKHHFLNTRAFAYIINRAKYQYTCVRATFQFVAFNLGCCSSDVTGNAIFGGRMCFNVGITKLHAYAA